VGAVGGDLGAVLEEDDAIVLELAPVGLAVVENPDAQHQRVPSCVEVLVRSMFPPGRILRVTRQGQKYRRELWILYPICGVL
jgi:hypothetical protein